MAIKFSTYRTTKPGFKARLMRWQPTGELGGVYVRAFGRTTAIYSTGK